MFSLFDHAKAWAVSYATIPAEISGYCALTMEECTDFANWYCANYPDMEYGYDLVITDWARQFGKTMHTDK